MTDILPMEAPECITDPQELDRTVDKFTEECNIFRRQMYHDQSPVKSPWTNKQVILQKEVPERESN